MYLNMLCVIFPPNCRGVGAGGGGGGGGGGVKLALRYVWYRSAVFKTNMFSDLNRSIALKPMDLINRDHKMDPNETVHGR